MSWPLSLLVVQNFLAYTLTCRSSSSITNDRLPLTSTHVFCFVKDSYERAVGWGDRCEGEQGGAICRTLSATDVCWSRRIRSSLLQYGLLSSVTSTFS
ncbi:hypothetical protein BDQ17DRAFT_1381402 [Cyathus striatus]|nr:hypothetical protein BDQ17DRAFT_1381402 [Cyathus striatus]